MIKLIDENELFNIATSVNDRSAMLPKHCDNFSERIGVKMISEDGTNFLQGFAAFDFYFKKGHLNGKIVHIWVHPACRSIGFGKALDENMKNAAFNYASDHYEEKLERVELAFSKKGTPAKTKRKNLGSVAVKTNYDDINKEKSVSIPENKKSMEDFSKMMNKPVDNENNEKINVEDIKIIANFEEKFINELIDDFNDPQAELPAISKNNVKLGAFCIQDDHGQIISALFVDFYKTAVGTCVKLLNIYTKEEFRNKGYAGKILKKSVKLINDFVDDNLISLFDTKTKIILANAVGVNKEYVANMLGKSGYTKNGESRGRISFSKEF